MYKFSTLKLAGAALALSSLTFGALSLAHAAPADTGAPVLLAQAAPAATPAKPAAGGAPLYKVVDGNKVDEQTLQGFHTWRAAACDRCHGANQEGMVGPSLINSLKVLSKDDFVKTLKEGRLDKGMPSWSSNPDVMSHMDQLYAYLKGRSDGAITKARVEKME